MDPNLLLLLGFLGIMYFVMIRPQQKRQRQHAEMMSNLAQGDDVITVGGLHGRIDEVGPDYVDLEVTDDVILRYQKSAVSKVVSPQTADDADADDTEPTDESPADEAWPDDDDVVHLDGEPEDADRQ